MLDWFTDDRALLVLSTAIYTGVFLLSLGQLFRNERYGRPLKYIALWGAFIVQFMALSVRGKEIGGCPLGNPMEIIQFLTWSAVFLFLVTFPFYRLNLLGIFVAGFASILNILSLAVPGWDYSYEERVFGGNPWIELHAALAMFSYGMLGVLALISIMFLIQQRGLKAKRSKPIFNFLPSIQELDMVGSRLLITGIILMTFALGVGFNFILKDPDTVSISKFGVTTALWIAYIVVFILKWRNILRPQRFAMASITLFAGLLISLGPVSGDPKDELGEQPLLETNG
ncbi:MAG: cytochrome C assembly family protein [Opitutales bacterium]